MKSVLKKLAPTALLVLILIISSFIYLSPGIQALFEKRTDVVMSDGTDTTSAPRTYDRIEQMALKNPSRLLYGTLYVDSGDPESGDVLWVAWNERILPLLFVKLFPVEQISTVFVFILMILDGLCMYLLCSYLGWSKWVSYGLSFAWAFNVYTRARAKVHVGFVGIYHLPLIFLSFLLIIRGKSKRSLIAAMFALLIAGTVAHYYLVTCMFLTPLFLLYIYFQPEFRSDFKRILVRFIVAVIPLILLLGSSYVFMLPPEAPLTKEESIAPEVTTDGSPHVFLQVFHAYPIDYIAGDLGLVGTSDLNPLRGMISDYVRENLGYGNAHERSNGIRWSIIALTILAFFLLLKGKFKSDPLTQKNIIYFLIF